MPTAVEEKLIDIKFKLDMYYSLADSPESTLEKIEEVIKPNVELNENQQIVFGYLASENRLTKEAPMLSINNFSQDHFGGKLPEKVEEAYRKLNAKEDYEVLAAFAEWGMKEVAE